MVPLGIPKPSYSFAFLGKTGDHAPDMPPMMPHLRWLGSSLLLEHSGVPSSQECDGQYNQERHHGSIDRDERLLFRGTEVQAVAW